MIITLIETENGEAAEISLETLALARDLSSKGGGILIRAAVVGEVADADALAAQLGRNGVGEVHQATGEAFASFSGAAWAAALQDLRASTKSVVVMAGGSPRGMEVLAHLSARLGVPFAANVVSFGGLSPFLVTRQVVGGSALEEMKLDVRPAVFTMAGHAVAAAEVDGGSPASWHTFAPEVADKDLVARVKEVGQKEADQSDGLKSAKVIIGAGRGAGGPDGFGPVDELASLLGGVVGVSRVVTSLGWRPHHEQVGQTGSRISPDIYVPCGISGAIQHWAGCSSSKVILAVNTDAEAPMVTKANYAVVGDMQEVLPAIIEEIRARKG